MRKLTLRDLLATLITAAVVVPFAGYSVRGVPARLPVPEEHPATMKEQS